MQSFSPTNLFTVPSAGTARLASSRRGPVLRQACRNACRNAGRSRLVCRAEDGRKKINPIDPKKEAQFAESLAKGGITKDTAKKILLVWQQAGIDDPDQLRKMLVGRSLRTLGTGMRVRGWWAGWSSCTSACSYQPTARQASPSYFDSKFPFLPTSSTAQPPSNCCWTLARRPPPTGWEWNGWRTTRLAASARRSPAASPSC